MPAVPVGSASSVLAMVSSQRREQIFLRLLTGKRGDRAFDNGSEWIRDNGTGQSFVSRLCGYSGSMPEIFRPRGSGLWLKGKSIPTFSQIKNMELSVKKNHHCILHNTSPCQKYSYYEVKVNYRTTVWIHDISNTYRTIKYWHDQTVGLKETVPPWKKMSNDKYIRLLYAKMLRTFYLTCL